MIELLVAGLLSSMVLLAVYFVFIGNTTQYYRQEQIVQMQESMRFALEYLKNDLRNAGRLGLIRGAGLNRDPRLCTDRANLAALTLCEDDADPALARLRANGNGLDPDRIRMVGDSGGGVTLKTSRVRPDVVVLAPAAEQATVEARSIVGSRRRLERMFGPGALLAVRAPGHANSLDVVEVESLAFNAGGSTIRLAEPLCNDPAGVVSPALAACSGECLVSPVQIIEYAVEPDPDPRREREGATRLVRRVLPAEAVATTCDEREEPLEALEMAEMVVDLQLWGMYVDLGRLALPDDADPTDDLGNRAGANEQAVMTANLEQLRSLTVMLAVRTPREDPEYTVAVGRADAPNARVQADRSWFEMDPAPGTGLARVTTLTATVDAMNFVPAL